MAMRLYQRKDIMSYAATVGLSFDSDVEGHIIFVDGDGEPYSVPCDEYGCPDFLYDLFVSKVEKSCPKVVGIKSKSFDVRPK